MWSDRRTHTHVWLHQVKHARETEATHSQTGYSLIMETETKLGYGYLVEYKRIDGRMLLGRVTAPKAQAALETAIARFPGLDQVLRVNRIPATKPVVITQQELLLVRQGVKTTKLL